VVKVPLEPLDVRPPLGGLAHVVTSTQLDFRDTEQDGLEPRGTQPLQQWSVHIAVEEDHVIHSDHALNHLGQ